MSDLNEEPTLVSSSSDVLKNNQDLEILDLLGRGSMGSVYRGRQPLLDRYVAVKFLNPPPEGKYEEFADRFKREARILAGLNHRNIVSCYHAGVDAEQNQFYLVMELINGPDISQYVKKNGPLQERLALKVFRDTANALQEAHHAKIIHRDVKPGNIMLQMIDQEKSGATGFPFTVKLADLGLARVQMEGEMELTQAGTVMGTPVYMAPEQFDNPDHVDYRADIYALGGVLFYALTGQPPYKGASVTQIMKAKFNEPPPDPRPLRKDISNDVAEIIRKTMARDRNERPDSYQDLIDEADRLLSGSPSSAQPAAGFTPVIWALSLTGLLLAAIGGGVYYVNSMQSEETLPTAATNQQAGGAIAAARESAQRNEITVIESEVETGAGESDPAPSQTPDPTPSPSPTPTPVSPDSVAFSRTAESLFGEDYLTRLDGWSDRVGASFGSDEEGPGIIGSAAEEGMIVYEFEPGPWKVAGVIERIDADGFGVFAELEDGSMVRLLFQYLGGAYLIRQEHIQPDGSTEQISTASADATELTSFILTTSKDGLFFVHHDSETLPIYWLSSPPVGFGLYVGGGSIRVQRARVFYGE